MKKLCVILLLSISFAGNAQTIQLLKFDELNSRAKTSNDTLYILNFWATWCAPCIHELPYFEQCNEEFKSKPVKFILVNLDLNSKVKSQAEPFVLKKNLKSSIVHPTESDPGTWINRVDSSWSGAIPATSMYRNGKKVFFKEGEMTLEELQKTLNSNLNSK